MRVDWPGRGIAAALLADERGGEALDYAVIAGLIVLFTVLVIGAGSKVFGDGR